MKGTSYKKIRLPKAQDQDSHTPTEAKCQTSTGALAQAARDTHRPAGFLSKQACSLQTRTEWNGAAILLTRLLAEREPNPQPPYLPNPPLTLRTDTLPFIKIGHI